ncbi:hypothetical protein ACFQ0B_12420 [Nonomuraea thailandensis]
MQEAMGARMSSAWSLLAGRTTYERFADYWPRQARTRSPTPSTGSANTWSPRRSPARSPGEALPS